LKLSFDKSLAAFASRHNQLAEKQTQVFAEAFARFHDAREKSFHLSRAPTLCDYDSYLPVYTESSNEAMGYFFAHRLFFPEKEALMVEALYTALGQLVSLKRDCFNYPLGKR
jgi:hypothetical protein